MKLPDGASLQRTKAVLDQVSEIAGKAPAVENVVAIAGVSALDDNSTLANAGVAYIVLKEWSARGAGQDLRSLYVGLNERLSVVSEARVLVIPPPPIQGIGNAAGFAMQLMKERGVTTLDQWFSDFVETDWRYVERYYQTDALPHWEDCIVRGAGMVTPTPIPPLKHRQVEVRFAF